MSKIADELAAARRLTTMHAEQLKRLRLTVLSFLVLDMMCDTGDPELTQDYRQSDIARQLEIVNNDARRLLKQMEEAGLVERMSVRDVIRFAPSPKREKAYAAALKELTG